MSARSIMMAASGGAASGYQDVSMEDGVVRIDYNSSTNVYSVVYSKHSTGVPNLTGSITQDVITFNTGQTSEYPTRVKVSGDGLVLYVLGRRNSTERSFVQRYSRANLSGTFIYRHEYRFLAGSQPLNIHMSRDGTYTILSLSSATGYDLRVHSFMKFSDATYSELHYTISNAAGISSMIAVQDSKVDNKLYFIAGGTAPSEGTTYYEPLFGYINKSNDTVSVTQSSNGLRSAIGYTLSSASAAFGFCNLSKSFILASGESVMKCTFSDSGITGVTQIGTAPYPAANNNALGTNLLVDKSDNFFMWSSSSSACYVMFGWRNISSGVWSLVAPAASGSVSRSDPSLSASGAYVVRPWGLGQIQLLPVNYTGTSFSLGSVIQAPSVQSTSIEFCTSTTSAYLRS